MKSKLSPATLIALWVPWRIIGLVVLALAISQIGCGSAVAQRRSATRTATGKATATATRPAAKADQSDAIPAADAKDIGQNWVRMQYDAKGDPIGMQTAIVRYAPAKSNDRPGRPVTIDLIGAVHIADAAYYHKLNERFKQYDALLYELVAPEGTKVPLGRGTSNLHPIGAMQNLAKDVLELDHQLEFVDYTKPNFIHADMSPDEFEKAMKDRNESFLQMYFKLMGAAMAQQSKLAAKGESEDVDLIGVLFAADRARQLKIVLAKQLSQMQDLIVSFGGEEGSTIINERNKKALGVLKTQLASGKKHVGIFYGAGHLSDMDKHLRSDFHMQPVSITWLTAWDLSPKD